jgi:soluble lytic murein transglycosylase-like protein
MRALLCRLLRPGCAGDSAAPRQPHATEAASRLRIVRLVLALAATASTGAAWAGNQVYEPLSDSVRTAMSHAIDDQAPVSLHFDNPQWGYRWLTEMAARLKGRIPDLTARVELIKAVHYEATRAGLDPQLVLSIIQVESGFRKYAVSSAGARGLMQVMPFWTDLIGTGRTNLFHLRINLRYGCVILRHYLDMENGDLFRALGRYNGSLGRAEYPDLVLSAYRQWSFPPPSRPAPLLAMGNTAAGPAPGGQPQLSVPARLTAPGGMTAAR